MEKSNAHAEAGDEGAGISPAEIAELKLKHGGVELHLLELEIGDELHQVVVRQPGPEFDEWRNQRDLEGATADSKRRADANFVNAVRVWPDAAAWLSMANRRRALATTFAAELAELAGVSRSARRKKL